MRECARESMARAPTAAPDMNTSNRTAHTAMRASQLWRKRVRSSNSVLIGSQSNQHIILRVTGIKRRGLLLGHDGLGSGRRLEGALAHPKITAENGKHCQGGESHAPPESELPAKQA